MKYLKYRQAVRLYRSFPNGSKQKGNVYMNGTQEFKELIQKLSKRRLLKQLDEKTIFALNNPKVL